MRVRDGGEHDGPGGGGAGSQVPARRGNESAAAGGHNGREAATHG